MNNKDIHLDLLRKLESNPEFTQREPTQDKAQEVKRIVKSL